MPAGGGAGRSRLAPRGTFRALLPLLLALGCGGGGNDKNAAKRPPPVVVAAPPVSHSFVERIDAVGTARAREQVTLSAAVTERIERLYFDDGMAVRRGQLLAKLSQEQERASLAGALAAEQQAQSQLVRIQQLSKRGFATQTLLDQQVAAAQRARADAAEARAQIADRVIVAPFSGFVSLRTVSEGAVVNASTPLVTISDISAIKLDFTVPETMLSALRVGQSIEAVASSSPDTPFVGRISSIDPVIDPSSRAVLVRAVLPNPGGRIKPGMLMDVHVQTSVRVAPAVPELAVVGDGEDRYVFIIGNDGKAKRVSVRTGLRDKGLIEVSGIPAGAKVIGEGVVKVADGMKIKLAGVKDKRLADRATTGDALAGKPGPGTP